MEDFIGGGGAEGCECRGTEEGELDGGWDDCGRGWGLRGCVGGIEGGRASANSTSTGLCFRSSNQKE